jgi:hypothetical protein
LGGVELHAVFPGELIPGAVDFENDPRPDAVLAFIFKL